MSEPNPGTPAPANNPQGTGQAPEQPKQTAPNPAPTTPQAPTPPAAPATPPPVDPALQQRLEQAEKAARHYQSQFSQARNQLQALTGAQPQADPLADDIDYLRKKGYDDQNARDMAEFMARKLQPIQQRNQQLEAQIQGSSVAQQAMQAAVSANPELFSDQTIATEVWNSMQNTAHQGNLQVLTPEYAKFLGAQA